MIVKEKQLTRSGVAYDLKLSPHRRKIEYTENVSLIFVFSSGLYKTKFEEKLIENRQKINGSLSKRFGFEIRNDVLCDLKLYTSIEKRGFLIEGKKEGFECLSSLKLDGKSLTARI